jgi:predicted lysophospholipase L1 biosynthesis ABC-type transport system permease subunit
VTASFTTNVRLLNGGDVAVTADTPLTPAQLGAFDQLQARGTLSGYTADDNVRAQVHTSTAALRLTLRAVDPASFPLPGGVTFSSPANGSLASQLHGDNVVITSHQAQAFDLHVGDAFNFSAADGRAATVTVAGIIASTGFFQGTMTLMAYDAYAALPSALGQPAAYNEVYADVPGHTDANAATAEQQIQAQLPLAAIQTTKELLAAQQSEVSMVTYFLQIIGLLALLIGGVGIVNTVQVSLRRRRVEIAMLKTAGYRRRDLFGMFGLETGLVGLLGGLVGAAAGAGVSFLIGAVMARALQVDLPTSLDTRTIVAGVAVGFVTALIFGLLPIAQASAVRPIAVLRELPERLGISARLASLGLAALVALLFFALAASIVQNPLVAAAALGVTAVVLALLGLVLGVLVLVISKLPVLERFRLPQAVVALVAVAGGVALLPAQPALSLVLFAVAALAATMLLPRRAKANVRLALRNIGRRKARSVATLLALTVGIFAVGLVLVLGQDIQGQLSTYLTGGDVNVAVLAGGADRSAVERQLAQIPNLTHESMNIIAQVQPVSIDGRPVSAYVQAAVATDKYSANDVTRELDGLQGYDLAGRHAPSASLFVIKQGTHDARPGRDLTPADAGSGNALLPIEASRAPLDLKLGDTITLEDPATHAQATITVSGFFNYTLQFEPLQVDAGIVTALSHGNPSYLYLAHVDPNTADAALAHVQAAVPSAQTFSVADLFAQITSVLNNLVTVLVTIASLAMLAAIIIIANAVALAMLERRRELGILKAVGYTSRSVLGEVLVENGAIGFTGGVVAMLLAALAAQALGSLLFNATFRTPALVVLVIVPASAALCMLVAAGVAWGATRVRPLEVLRYE